MERIKYRFIVYNKLWSNPKMNLYVTNPQFNNIHAVAHLHAGVHPCLALVYAQLIYLDIMLKAYNISCNIP